MFICQDKDLDFLSRIDTTRFLDIMHREIYDSSCILVAGSGILENHRGLNLVFFNFKDIKSRNALMLTEVNAMESLAYSEYKKISISSIDEIMDIDIGITHDEKIKLLSFYKDGSSRIFRVWGGSIGIEIIIREVSPSWSSEDVELYIK